VNNPAINSMIPDTVEEGVVDLITHTGGKIVKHKTKDMPKEWPKKPNKEAGIKKPKEVQGEDNKYSAGKIPKLK
jgi:hypothetical protein